MSEIPSPIDEPLDVGDIDADLEALESERDGDVEYMTKGLAILLNASFYLKDLQDKGLLHDDFGVFFTPTVDAFLHEGERTRIRLQKPHKFLWAIATDLRAELIGTGHADEAEEVYKRVTIFHRPEHGKR